MKKLLLIFAFVGLCFSCSNSDDIDPDNLVGVWKLEAYYADPGDGSGDFVETNSLKVIEFRENGTFISNGVVCTMGLQTDDGSTGIYVWDIEVDELGGYIYPENCDSGARAIIYQMTNGKLELWFPCIEGCAERYKKIK